MSETETEESGWSVQSEPGAETESVQSEQEAGLTGVNKKDENDFHKYIMNISSNKVGEGQSLLKD